MHVHYMREYLELKSQVTVLEEDKEQVEEEKRKLEEQYLIEKQISEG